MFVVAPSHEFIITGRVTVGAPVKARVVYADVFAHDATTRGALSGVFCERSRSVKVTNQLTVDTATGWDAEGPKFLILGARTNLHTA